MKIFAPMRVLSILSAPFFCAALLGGFMSVSGCTSPVVDEETRQNSKLVSSRKVIRFYAANKLGQEDRLTTVRDTESAGCHNLFRSRKAYRVAVVGFEACSVFSEPDCPASAAMNARWDGKARRDENKKKPTSTLTVGTSWIIGIEGAKKPNVRIASWSCQ